MSRDAKFRSTDVLTGLRALRHGTAETVSASCQPRRQCSSEPTTAGNNSDKNAALHLVDKQLLHASVASNNSAALRARDFRDRPQACHQGRTRLAELWLTPENRGYRARRYDPGLVYRSFAPLDD